MKGKQLANGKRRKLKQKKKEKAFTLDDIIIKQLMDLKKKKIGQTSHEDFVETLFRRKDLEK